MKGITFRDIQSVLSFMYHGEANIAQEDLNNFLAVAEDLRVKGLTQGNSDASSSNSAKLPRVETEPSRHSKDRLSGFRKPVAAQSMENDDIQEVAPVKQETVDRDTLKTVAGYQSFEHAQDTALAPAGGEYDEEGQYYEDYDETYYGAQGTMGTVDKGE